MCGDHASAMRMLEVPILSSEPPPEASLCPSPACSRSRRAQRRATERPEPPAAAPWSFGRRNPSAARMARTRRCPQRARWHPSFAMGSGLLSLVAALMSPRPSPRGRPKLKACDPSATPVLCLRTGRTGPCVTSLRVFAWFSAIRLCIPACGSTDSGRNLDGLWSQAGTGACLKPSWLLLRSSPSLCFGFRGLLNHARMHPSLKFDRLRIESGWTPDRILTEA